MDKTLKDKTISKEAKMSDNEQAFVEYCVKKAEKISSAIYVISNFIPNSDPMRHSIRKSSLRLLSDIFSISNVSDMGNGTRTIVFGLTSQVIPEILSLVKISRTSGFISEMNASVLERELNYFQKTLAERFGLNTALLLTKKDFDVSGGYVPQLQAQAQPSAPRNSVSYPKQKPTNVPKGQKVYKVATKKSKRRSTILDLLKDTREIGVKDAALKLPEYSEKTIQRELMKMVSEGVLKREGERRWSRYSLA